MGKWGGRRGQGWEGLGVVNERGDPRKTKQTQATKRRILHLRKNMGPLKNKN